MRYLFTTLLFGCQLLSAAPLAPQVEEEGPAAVEAEPASEAKVKDLGDGAFSLGKVTFHQASRHISFPARVNMVEGLLEFAIVHQDGKIHESLLLTEASPLHLNIALKLLRYQASKELFPILDDDFTPTDKYPEVPEETKAAARVEILVTWTKSDGTEATTALSDWIHHAELKSAIKAIPWIYGGSYMYNGVFQARSTGNIAAIFTANSALFNYPGKDRELDTVWIPAPKRVPPVDTPVIVLIKPVLSTPIPPNK
jgi:hypothetical protein